MSSRFVANATGLTAAYWLQISVTVACDVADCVEEALEVFGAIAVSRTDAGNSPQFDVAEPGDPRWALQTVAGVFDPSIDVGACTTMLTGIIGEQITVQIDQLADQDWELCGRTQFQPIKISDRLWVCPPWQTTPDTNALNLVITPGLAFGTGTHPTTQLCLTLLEQSALKGCSVLDWGCGSGILAVAALRMGATQATAVDLDPRALTATQENAKRNRVNHGLSVMSVDQLPHDVGYDIVLANILAGTLISLAPTLDRHLLPGGTLILSGVLPAQADQVQQAFTQYNFRVLHRDDWVALQGQRTAG